MATRRPPLSPQRRRGAAAVEFAMLLALLITIVAGIVGVGRAMWYYDALSKATRNGARALSVSDPAALVTAVEAARTAVSIDAASAGLPAFTSANVDIGCLDEAMRSIACANGSAPAGVRVAVSGYAIVLGAQIPFLLNGNTSFSVPLAPATTMPYMR